MDKQDLFYANKKRIEQAWSLLEVARDLIHDIVDESGTNLEGVHEIYEKLVGADEQLYPIYDMNKDLHHEG